ncbi:MAG: MFS transporter [Nitrospirae bacterium]|nr:MAG: MFS transporter [Nitrospirota bacterium]
MNDGAAGPVDGGEQSRRCGTREGVFQAIMLGGGENYLSAFALLLHASAFQVGLLSALPQLIGTWAQLLSVKALGWVRHRKSLILTGVAGQAFVWLPLLALPLIFPEQGPWLLIACAVAYVAMGHIAIPAWNSLLTDLVDPNRRGAYFGHRARVMAVTSFAALCGAGLILHSAEAWERPWMGFAVIFLAASAARGVSTIYLARIDESAVPVTREDEFRLLAFLRREHGVNFRRFLLFSGLMHACVLIAGPYFVVYMLRDLHLSYLDYALWLAAGVLGQFLTLKPWGRLGDRYGNKKVVAATGLLVPFLPMLYVVSANLYFLLAVNFVGGVIWAGLALGLQNYVFDAVRPEDRAKGVAIWNSVNAAGWFVGAMLGSVLAGVLPGKIALAGLAIRPASNLPFVFFISGLLRLVVSLSLLRTFHEARRVEPISHRELVAELPLIKPLTEAFGGGNRRDS